jgi:hypothetical protein
MEEARTAMATFQKLKDEEAGKSQEQMKKSIMQRDSNPTSPPPPLEPQNPQ